MLLANIRKNFSFLYLSFSVFVATLNLGQEIKMTPMQIKHKSTYTWKNETDGREKSDLIWTSPMAQWRWQTRFTVHEDMGADL